MLRELAALNPERLHLLSEEADGFRVRLLTGCFPLPGPGMPRRYTLPGDNWLVLSIEFAPYYPAVPIEIYSRERELHHPNVHPLNGFICLWDKHSSGDTVIEALRQTQRVLSGELRNAQADHLMQPMALHLETIPYEPLRLPEGYLMEREARGFRAAKRQRLTPWALDLGR